METEVLLAEGKALEHLGKYDASESALRRALRVGTHWRQWDAVRRAATSLILVVGSRQQRMEEGLRYRELAEGLAVGSPREQASIHNNVAAVLYEMGRHADAEAENRSALALWEQALGADHPDVATSRNNLANILYAQGKVAEAEDEHRRALTLRESALGPDHPNVAASRNNLANVLRAQGKYADAETEHRRALASWEQALGPEHPSVATSRNNLANVLQAQGKYQDAEAEHRRALTLREQALGPEHPSVALSRDNLGLVLHAQGKDVEAEAEHRRALVLRQQVLGAEHRDVAESRNNLATVLLAQGRSKEALGFAEQAWTRIHEDDIAAESQARTAFMLARALTAADPSTDARARAQTLAQRALEIYTSQGAADAAQADAIEQWLRRE